MDQYTGSAPRRSFRASVPPFTSPDAQRPAAPAPPRGSRPFFTPSGLETSHPAPAPVAAARAVAVGLPTAAQAGPVAPEFTPPAKAMLRLEEPLEPFTFAAPGGAEPESLDELFAALAEGREEEEARQSWPAPAGPESGLSTEDSGESIRTLSNDDFTGSRAEAAEDTPGRAAESPAGDVEPPSRTPAGGPMVVDFSDVVGGAPEASFSAEPIEGQSLGKGVFSALAPWAEGGEGSPEVTPPPPRFPTPSIFLQTIEAQGAERRVTREQFEPAGLGDDPAHWDPVPESEALRQIVEARVGAGVDGAAIAAALERVAERVRRGELSLPSVAAEGDAGALALALAAILQPDRK